MAKQIMIRDDIAAELDKIREERSCSYSVVIDELLSEREKNAPERANDFFTAAAAFEKSNSEYRKYDNMRIEKDPHMTFGDMLKDEKGMSKFRQHIKNYLICEDLIKCLSEKDVEEHKDEIRTFLILEILLFNDCQNFISKSLEIIFSSSRKKVLEGWKSNKSDIGKVLSSSSQEKISLSLLV